MAYICTPGELVILASAEEPDFMDGSPGLVQGIKKGQVEIKLLHNGRQVLMYPENFLDANEESGENSIDDEYVDDDSEDVISLSEINSIKKKMTRSKSGGGSQTPSKKLKVFVPSAEMVAARSASMHLVEGSSELNHNLYSSSAGNIFLQTDALHPEMAEPELTTDGDEEASHWLRNIRMEIEAGNLNRAEHLLRNILTYHQYTAAAWIELATIKSMQCNEREMIQAIHKACHSCPLKSDFQTHADTIQMYLIASRLLNPTSVTYQTNPTIQAGTDSTANEVSVRSMSDRKQSLTTAWGTDGLPIPPPPSAMPSRVDVFVENSTIESSQIHSKSSDNDDADVACSVKPTVFPRAESAEEVFAELSIPVAVSQQISEHDQFQRLWLRIRTLVRGLNVVRAAGITIQFFTSAGAPVRGPGGNPAIVIDAAHEYLRAFVADLLFGMGQALYDMSEACHKISRPCNCLAGAYIMLKLCCQQVDREGRTDYLELYTICEDKLRDEGALV